MVAKELKFCNSRYQGSLTVEACDKLEQIIALDKQNGSFGDLKHIIYELSDSDVVTLIEDVEKNGQQTVEIERRVGTLTDMQTLGAAFMLIASSCILGDSVGLGKTAQVAALCRMLANVHSEYNKPFRYLLLTEKNLIVQTRHKMVKFTGEYVAAVKGDAVSFKKFANTYPNAVGLSGGIVGGHTLLNQSLFIEWITKAMTFNNGTFPFDLLIIDESSVLGNLGSGITKNAKALIPYFKRVIMLNATPFETKLDTFYAQLSLVDKKLLPSKTEFQNKYVVFNYAGMYPKATGKYKNCEQFRQLVGYRYFARTRREKGAIMEGCTGRVIVSELSPIQKKWLRKTQVPQLVYDCPNELDPDIVFNEINVPKLGSLMDALNTDCADAETVLLFVHYKSAQLGISEFLSKHGYSNRVLCGDTKDVEREEVIKGFKNAEYRVLITNVQKGLDFGDCNYCIFYSFDPNPSKMVQFEGRITRSFDIVGKHVILLCSAGRELKRLNEVIKTRAQASSEFTKADLSCIMAILLDEG